MSLGFDSMDINKLDVVYEEGTYVILRMDNNFILWNTAKGFKDGHTHLKSLKVAKEIVLNCKSHKKPKTCNMYLLSSHIRVSDDDTYVSYIEDLIAVKKEKNKKDYYNSKGRRLR